MKRSKWIDARAVMRRAKDIPGIWSIWSPTINIATQGENPEHAIGMFAEAAQMVVLESLTAHRYQKSALDPLDGDFVLQRVVHPDRLKAPDDPLDEDWKFYDDYENSGRPFTSMSLSELDGSGEDAAIVTTVIEWKIFGGIPIVGVMDHWDSVQVPARVYDVEYFTSKHNKRRVLVPESKARVCRDESDVHRLAVEQSSEWTSGDISSIIVTEVK